MVKTLPLRAWDTVLPGGARSNQSGAARRPPSPPPRRPLPWLQQGRARGQRPRQRPTCRTRELQTTFQKARTPNRCMTQKQAIDPP